MRHDLKPDIEVSDLRFRVEGLGLLKGLMKGGHSMKSWGSCGCLMFFGCQKLEVERQSRKGLRV